MASLDDYQFLDSFKRKCIKLTTKSCVFVGVVQRINLNKTVILEDVVEVKSGTRLPGSKLFFGHEIFNVEFPEVSKQDAASNSGDQNPGQLTVTEFQPYRNKLMVDDEDKQYVNYVVIDEFHEKFGPALMHIRKQQAIGIGIDGIGEFQHERLCWLQIATKNKVYLFDILLLGGRAFKNGLSMILENDHILKVTHDCRRIAGCLMAQFRVNLTNVFDTQIADVKWFYIETGGFLPDRLSTLEEVVSLHLKMNLSHLSSLSIKAQLTSEDKEVWFVRPCPAPLLKIMALSVIHLQPLRLVLLDALMSDYTTMVNSYLHSGQNEPVHMQHIGKSGLALPMELRELEVIWQERQKWAVKHYPVTEDGLLERYNCHPASALGKQSLKHPGPGDSAVPQCTFLEGALASPEPLVGPLKTVPEAAQDTDDFTALGSGRQPDKESVSTITAVPGLGRGITLQVPVLASREGVVPMQSFRKARVEGADSDYLESASQPFSVVGGVAKSTACPPTVLTVGSYRKPC
ncbi:piRNA biogenesis protein EXD1 [Electrophorus electricus]|uniref:piRNA biogenesis protein EXD1 n=1 Tax=Electrophorus electricus TaxID=8005 RepID=UPI0015CF9D36|nr:piRNA biogenesis protein EXD1 [Electrophorus electricus]